MRLAPAKHLAKEYQVLGNGVRRQGPSVPVLLGTAHQLEALKEVPVDLRDAAALTMRPQHVPLLLVVAVLTERDMFLDIRIGEIVRDERSEERLVNRLSGPNPALEFVEPVLREIDGLTEIGRHGPRWHVLPLNGRPDVEHWAGVLAEDLDLPIEDLANNGGPRRGFRGRGEAGRHEVNLFQPIPHSKSRR